MLSALPFASEPGDSLRRSDTRVTPSVIMAIL